MMYDMLWLAFQTDSTRIATLLLAYDGSNRTFPDLGMREGHHWRTHSQRENHGVDWRYVSAIEEGFAFVLFLLGLQETPADRQPAEERAR